MIGVHSPEFEIEKDRGRVERFAAKFKITHPIFIDNDFAYWNALGNKFWPEFYLADRQGVIRGRLRGEMHEDSEQARRFDIFLRKLLAEDPAAIPDRSAAAHGAGYDAGGW